MLATDLAGIGGPDLPLEVSAIDSYAAVTDAPERSLTIVARLEVSLSRIFAGQEQLCDTLDRCLAVSHHLLERAPPGSTTSDPPSSQQRQAAWTGRGSRPAAS